MATWTKSLLLVSCCVIGLAAPVSAQANPKADEAAAFIDRIMADAAKKDALCAYHAAREKWALPRRRVS